MPQPHATETISRNITIQFSEKKKKRKKKKKKKKKVTYLKHLFYRKISKSFSPSIHHGTTSTASSTVGLVVQ